MSSSESKTDNVISQLVENKILQFRLMTESDISYVVRHVQSGYRGETSTIGWTHESNLVDGQRVDESMLIDVLRSKSEVYLLVYNATTNVDNDKTVKMINETCNLSENYMVGCIQLDFCTDIIHFGMFAVNPKLQNIGCGRWLLQNAEDLAMKRNIKRIGMSVISVREELIAWYKRRGFETTGITAKFPDDKRFGIPKVENLYFIEMEKKLEED